jgi:hypothetical protein
LQQVPPAEAVDKLGAAHPTHMPYLRSDHVKFWKYHMEKAAPRPAQVASMDKGSVLRLLGLLTKDRVLKRGVDVKPYTSSWIWSLLARLPERGELTSEEIGVVRELGKKAVLVGIGLKDGDDWDVGMQEVEAGLDDEWDKHGEVSAVMNEEIQIDLDADDDDQVDADEPSINVEHEQEPSKQQASDEKVAATIDELELSSSGEELETLRSRLLQRVDTEQFGFTVNQEPEIVEPCQESAGNATPPGPSKWNTKATVDMIITVAGEVYGQRDLLEFRGIWKSTV